MTTAPRNPPTSTYRLQLHEGFGFDEAAGVIPHLAELGISHAYLSPVLQAAPGSTHGYDVVDHTRISDALGGLEGFERLVSAAHGRDLGIVVDIVPNHMAVPTPASLNAPLWDVLTHGRASEYASWFDVDWDALDGRVGLPVLGAPLDHVLNAGQLTFGEGPDERPVLRYFDHVFPIAPGTEGDDVRRVLAAQHYLPAFWQSKAETLNYRRFFDVDSLIAVRVELPDVFEATHRTLLDLHDRGLIDGFRVDHPDGLADPEGYLARLADATDGAWVVVEKICEGAERIPASWRADGTTGYDGLAVIEAALTPHTGDAIERLWSATGGPTELRRVERDSRALVARELFDPEVQRLARTAGRAAPAHGVELSAADAAAGLRALLAHVDRYRAYLKPGEAAAPDQLEVLHDLAARTMASDPGSAAAVERLMPLLTDVRSGDPSTRDLVVRFQQVCGPVMAKGVEDTTFYRYHRLVALNEVGGDPSTLDRPGPSRLHAWADHQASTHPLSLVAGTTHDTKRSADARARLLAVAARPAGWASVWAVMQTLAARAKVDEPTAWMVAQNLVATWPIDPERMHAYVQKAVREGKQHTTWTTPDVEYERRLAALVNACCESRPLAAAISDTLAGAADDERRAVLGTTLLQLTVPGVPDIYQGCQTVSRTLVDPDNRRPVDHARLHHRLLPLLQGASAEGLADEKLRLTALSLRLRRRRPELFDTEVGYSPLDIAPGLVGFRRGEHVVVLALVPGAPMPDASLRLGSGSWRDEATGRVMTGTIDTGRLLATTPVCLLVEESR